jgi:HK97 family phage major capsid protein
MTTMSKKLTDLQIAKRDEIIAQGRDVIAAAEAEERELTDDEAAIVRDAAERSAEITATIEATASVTRSLDDLVPAKRAVGGAVVRSEPLTYMERGGKHSHVRDTATVALNLAGASQARERLERHAAEIAVELRAGDTGDTAGGTFVPPLWVLDEFVGTQRAGRATADLARQMALPSGTDAISIPTVTTGNLTAVQATENSAITTRDMVTASTTAEVTTIAGGYDFSIQLLEQSALAGGWDALVYRDLLADYNRALDVQVLSGTGANNQVPGVHTVAGTTVFASSTSSTTAQNQIYAGIADALNRVATTRFETPEVIVMHPRRWFWLASRFDTAGRPVIVPDAQAGRSMLASFGITAVQGVVGTMLGLPVVIDANVSTSAGTSEDRILVWKASDAILMEGTPTFEVFRTTGGTTDTLTARARLYNYAAFTTRYTTGAALVGGTALSSPTF